MVRAISHPDYFSFSSAVVGSRRERQARPVSRPSVLQAKVSKSTLRLLTPALLGTIDTGLDRDAGSIANVEKSLRAHGNGEIGAGGMLPALALISFAYMFSWILGFWNSLPTLIREPESCEVLRTRDRLVKCNSALSGLIPQWAREGKSSSTISSLASEESRRRSG